MIEPVISACGVLERLLYCLQSKSENSLVAMDFSGKAGGRVIENPKEAQRAEQEEGQAWRVRRNNCLSVILPSVITLSLQS